MEDDLHKAAREFLESLWEDGDRGAITNRTVNALADFAEQIKRDILEQLADNTLRPR